jgi:hypothetical protein
MLKPKKLIRNIKRLRNLWVEIPPRNRQLVYCGLELHVPEVRYRYSACGRTFTNRVVFQADTVEQFACAQPEVLERLLDTLGMIFVPYFFPLADFGTVSIESRFFHDRHRHFWEQFFWQGLAEFRYVNGLEPTRRIRVLGGASGEGPAPLKVESDPRLLLLNGGGKDTAVLIEIVRAMAVPFGIFSWQPNEARIRIAEIATAREHLRATTHIDEGIARFARYRWFSAVPGAVVSFLALIVAYLHRYRYVALGNEYSANFGNVGYRGMEINHQYTKSFEFETAFDEFVHAHLIQGIRTFSLLRPLYDLRIAKLFSRMEGYFPAFVSCNDGDYGTWCKRCPKCAFVFLALRAFLAEEKLREIFGENLFQRREIRAHLYDMVAGSVHPWECIGTKEECRFALRLVLDRLPGVDFPEWPRRRDLEASLRSLDVEAAQRTYLDGFHHPHRVPTELLDRLKVAVDSLS